MRNLSFYTSKKKLLKKTVFPAIAVFLLWFFVVVPDDDIGAGTDFFGFMTFILFAGIIGLLVFLFYQIKVIQKIPVLIITKSELILPRKKLRISLTKDLVFTASKIEGQEPPSEAIDIPFGIDLLVDRKDYFLYAWQNNKRIKDIYITYLNLDENIIAALLNDLIEKEENDREALIITFYEILLQKFGEKISNRLILSNQNEELKTTVFQEIREDNLEGISLKKEYKILSTIAAFFWIIYTLIAPSPFILFFSSIISAALYGLLFALIPYKKLKFKKKYPLGILSAWIFTAMVGLVIHISPFSTQTSYCDLPEIKTALKNAMVLDMRDWQRNANYAGIENFAIKVNQVVSDLEIIETRYVRSNDDMVSEMYLEQNAPGASSCICDSKIRFLNHEKYKRRIEGPVSKVKAEEHHRNSAYLSLEDQMNYLDNDGFVFSYVVIKKDNEPIQVIQFYPPSKDTYIDNAGGLLYEYVESLEEN